MSAVGFISNTFASDVVNCPLSPASVPSVILLRYPLPFKLNVRSGATSIPTEEALVAPGIQYFVRSKLAPYWVALFVSL